MWIPKSAEELELLVPRGEIEESATLDFKREVPNKSKSLAVDVAALANDGGVLIFGVGEDETKRPTLLQPFRLEGVPERISSIVRSSLSPPPSCEITTLPIAGGKGIGYLLVIVPASPTAPHMVVLNGENRFYGRGAKGNVVLTEAEVSRLYERRRSWEIDREQLIRSVVDSAPLTRHSDFGYLFLFARPAGGDKDLLAKAGEPLQELIQELIKHARSIEPPGFSPNFSYGAHRAIPEGWVVYMGLSPEFERKPQYVLDMELHFDGSARLFCGRAAQRFGGALQLFDEGVSWTTAQFLALLGSLFHRSGYFGPVDIGLALEGIEGVVSYTSRQRMEFYPIFPYRDPSYRCTLRVSASKLLDEPIEVARELLRRFFHAMFGGRFDPLERPE